MALGATVHVLDVDKTTSLPVDQQFFTGYRQTRVPNSAVISGVEVPLTDEVHKYCLICSTINVQFTHVRAYKQATRRDDDIAIVNACLLVRLDATHIVRAAHFAFGGMAAVTRFAEQTQAAVIGRFVVIGTYAHILMTFAGHGPNWTFATSCL